MLFFRVTRNRFSAFLLIILSGLIFSAHGAAPQTFAQAKTALKKHIYFDQNTNGALGTIYCGCDWQWVGSSGGRIEPERCGYQIRAIPNRGVRTEIEHIVPASWVGQQRQCWQNGGRKNCNKTDPAFNRIEADLHNMSVSVGELNADRSNFRFGVLPNTAKQHGQCNSKVDFKQRIFEPRDEVKGLVARVNFYMHDRYNLKMSEQQQRLFMAWDQQFPVSAWEVTREQRIASVMGHHNEFVTGQKTWRLGHRNSATGLTDSADNTRIQSNQQTQTHTAQKRTAASKVDASTLPIHGNRNSKIYHSKNCPSYNAMKKSNIVEFSSEAQAIKAGYRKAKNCP